MKKNLSALFRPLLERRGLILVVVIGLAALPALVDIHRNGESAEEAPPPEPTPLEALTRTADGTRWQDTPGDDLAAGSIHWGDESDYASVDTSDEPQPDEFDCMIEPWEEVSIRSPIIGRIDRIHVERADLIKEGDLLVELDSDLARAELGVAAKRADMTASIRSLEARRDLGIKRGERAIELFSQNAIALDARDEIMTEKEISSYDLEDAHDQYSLAQRQLGRERARFEQRRIKSPITGIVANRLMSVGEVVDEETVLELAQIDPLRVEVILPAIEFGSVSRGMKAAVIPEIPGDEVVVATVRLVDGIIDSASGTFGAELELPNPNHAIPGGLRCRVQFMDATEQAAEEATKEAAEDGAEDLARIEPTGP